jgi:ATP-dependent helicase/nuclease subunit B
LQVVIDRCDQLEDGSSLIIDYKTGKPSIADWFSDRPSEPQLPLYLILSNPTPSGILFAKVRRDEMHFSGLTKEQSTLRGAMTVNKLKGQTFADWDQLIAHWQSTLEQLADDFCCGVARVDPKSATTCEYCGLQALCRVNATPE